MFIMLIEQSGICVFTKYSNTITSSQRQAYVPTGVQFSQQAWRLPVPTEGEM